MRYPASLDLVVKRAVKDAIEQVKAQHPRYDGQEMTVVFVPAPKFVPLDDEMPEPAHAAAEEDMA